MKMFAAEVRGDLTSFIETRADTARQKVAELFMPQEMRETGQWSPELWKRAWLKARREGWRIVPGPCRAHH